MKNAHPVSEVSAADTADSNITNTSRAAQCKRIAVYLLLHQAATTIDLREKCNAMHPAGRIMELRRDGWEIALTWERSIDAQGREHTCGRYVLQSSGGAA